MYEYKIDGKVVTREAAQKYLRKYDGMEHLDSDMDYMEQDILRDRHNRPLKLADGRVSVRPRG